MAFHKTYGNHICQDIAKLIHHFYKKGVIDGSECGDEWTVKIITNREDFNNIFQFYSEFSQKCIDFNIMFYFIQNQFNLIKLKFIQHWFSRVRGGYKVKKAIILMCDEYYRKGLIDGVKTGKRETEEFISKCKSSFNKIREPRKNEESFLKEIIPEAMRIGIEREVVKDEMDKFVQYIAGVIGKRRDYFMKVKNEDLK